MTHNRQIIEQGYAAFKRGDIPAVLSMFAENVTFTIPGPEQMPMARTWRGTHRMQDFFATLDRELEFSDFSPVEYIAQGDRVVVLGSYAGRAKRNGKPFRSDWVMCGGSRTGRWLSSASTTTRSRGPRATAWCH
jgi:uncharacterized protein